MCCTVRFPYHFPIISFVVSELSMVAHIENWHPLLWPELVYKSQSSSKYLRKLCYTSAVGWKIFKYCDCRAVWSFGNELWRGLEFMAREHGKLSVCQIVFIEPYITINGWKLTSESVAPRSSVSRIMPRVTRCLATVVRLLWLPRRKHLRGWKPLGWDEWVNLILR